MITYKNISYSAKTFYGVKFEPGETKSVPGYINCASFVRVFDKKPKAAKSYLVEPVSVSNRGRKKKTVESVKETIAEPEVKITETISEEETSNGNPS